MFVTLLDNVTANTTSPALDCLGSKEAGFLISGSFEAAVKFEATLDGTNWFSVNGRVNGSLESPVAYSPCYATFDVGGFAALRVRVDGYKSGQVTVVGFTKPQVLSGCTYQHFNAATSGTGVKSGPGVLHAVAVNDSGSGMTLTLYDGTSTSGTVLGVIKPTAPVTLTYDARFATGLFVVIDGTTVGDITLSFE
ncbi:MAG TPA: hypothetical protein GXX50_10930 [Firmicutes bacterium]|nr:hypothetical protein [Bacillota bacterium]